VNYDLWRTTEPPAEEPCIRLPAVTCAGCGRTGKRDSLATAFLCWSCWAVQYATEHPPRGGADVTAPVGAPSTQDEMANMRVMLKLEHLSLDEIATLVCKLRDAGELTHAAELEALGELIQETGARTVRDVLAAMGTECMQKRAMELRVAVFARHGSS
jgi:hypothetical protein